ncbi:PREDICTED: MICAL-like protein 1 isoform X2 [Cyprinodon variegatus]|uniref:MICAL-like protein 1 isoform X2 n=1 Tax=Cyprinodon variegatus TaxID=28743 RepID=UPI0007428451|nr:PREDICTED: MICAL-like protein 1 isoform X2 [Cyprinodon variegatus]
MASPKALLEWCRVTCAGYPAVEIKNMSGSFRDGLAFCAIIHKHRPDLIDFSSLSRENVYQNNKLAFEVAETKLGIPPLLDPKDMVSTTMPDFLSVITYVSHYYNFFSAKSHGPSRSRSSHVLNISKGYKTLRSQKSLTELETSREGGCANASAWAVCTLCLKPVHLIQRYLIDGKVYHRGCFRCKICSCVLLPGCYTQGRDTTSFVCTHHVTDSKAAGVDSNRNFRSADKQPDHPSQTVVYSLSGLAICSVPRYAPRAESRDKLVSKTHQNEETQRLQGKNRENPHPLHPGDLEQTVEDSKGQKALSKTSELSLSSTQGTEGGAYPAPTPRKCADSPGLPVPAPRSRTTQTMGSSPAAEIQSESSPHPSRITSPKVKSNHPWMTIVHPGPWSQLPPVPPPVPLPRSKTVSNPQTPWNRPRMSAPNPFEEEEEENEAQQEAPKQQSANQGEASATAVHSEKSENSDVEAGLDEGEKLEQDEECSRSLHDGAEPDPAEGQGEGSIEKPTEGGPSGASDATEPGLASEQRSNLPRSLSVPAIPSERSETDSPPAGLDEANLSISSCEHEPAYKESPFAHPSEMPRSQTVQNLSSTRGPAPGHGFPLIRREVRTDQSVSMEDLRLQIRNLDGHLEALEKRGVDLERNIRECRMGKEEQMLIEWFILVHEQHILLRRNKDLVYLTKQQILEDRQADVEYELRCLLNKPEKDWSQEDKSREERLMAELVTIIEQRNQIISTLDQDRERDEDFESIGNKGFQQDGLKELRKSKGKLKASKVFKILN